jgi:hypothetical protein
VSTSEDSIEEKTKTALTGGQNRKKVDLGVEAQAAQYRSLNETTQNLIKTIKTEYKPSRDFFEQSMELSASNLETMKKHIINQHTKTQAVIIHAIQQNTPSQSSGPGQEPEKPKLVEFSTQEIAADVLGSLSFPDMYDRQVAVPMAYQRTFDWTYNHNESHIKWASFASWLRSRASGYWINGKAGSGKSTYLIDNYKTREALSEWSNRHTLDISSFFFWKSGTAEQKSLASLRSLLYNSLRQQERLELVRIVLPDLWHQALMKRLRPYEPVPKWKWNHNTIKEAFTKLCSQNVIPLKICLFIDGLDESEEQDNDHTDIVETIMDLAALPNLKICVLSRPLPVFEFGFKAWPGIRLQDLTFNDIRLYVTSELENHEKMLTLAQEDKERAHQLILEIMTAADGVFLWVVLAVKSLLEGLTNRDRIVDLQKRLHLLLET